MVSIFTGVGAGFERGSGAVLGDAGVIGTAATGRSGEQVSVNAMTGNLMISQLDEFLVGRGPDASVARTYNSRDFSPDSDNGDNWRQSTDRILKSQGTINAAGSTVTRISGDGSEIVYKLVSQNSYATTDGGGAYDRLTYQSSDNSWTWIDGDTRITEKYTALPDGKWRIASQADISGNSLTFTYTDNKLTEVKTANGESLTYGWTGSQITSIITKTFPDTGGTTLNPATKTTYKYDSNNRLNRVEVDVTPENLTDSSLFITQYEYVGSTGRISAIVQKNQSTDPNVPNGSRTEFTYEGDRVKTFSIMNGASTQTTTLFYDLTAERVGCVATRIVDPLLRETRLEYRNVSDLKNAGALARIKSPDGRIVDFDYNDNGDLTSVTDAMTKVSGFQYNADGFAVVDTDRLTNKVVRTYQQNLLTTETRTASDQSGNANLQTTRYVYQSDRLRYEISAEGRVTEHRYDTYGQMLATLDYVEQSYAVAALASDAVPTLSAMDAWATAITDKSSIQVVEMTYDTRGNLKTSTVITADGTASVGAGAGTVAEAGSTPTPTPTPPATPVSQPREIVSGFKTTVTALSNGYYRIVKGVDDNDYSGDARSTVATSGDFIVELRTPGNPTYGLFGISESPANSGSTADLAYSMYIYGNTLYCYGSKQTYQTLGTLTAGQSCWMVRTGSDIKYFRGADYDSAVAAGALITIANVSGTYYFDCSIVLANTNYDVRFTLAAVAATPAPPPTPQPLTIVPGLDSAVQNLGNGMYRATKLSGGFSSSSDVRSSQAMTGDFTLQIRPMANGQLGAVGIATNPALSGSTSDLDHGFFFQDASAYRWERGVNQNTPLTTFAAGENFWLVRSGTNLSFYKGSSYSTAVSAGALFVKAGVSGTYYVDSCLMSGAPIYDIGGTYLPAASGAGTTGGSSTGGSGSTGSGSGTTAGNQPAQGSQAIVAGLNSSVTVTTDGMYRLTKTGGNNLQWDSDARSTASLTDDFVIQVRPGQANKYLMAGISKNPTASAERFDLAYSIYLTDAGQAFAWEGNTAVSLNTTYTANDSFWLARSGGDILYYKGATLAAAVAAGPLRVTSGANGAYFFDSSLYQTGVTCDVSMMAGTTVMASVGVAARTGTAVAVQVDGSYRITKNAGMTNEWNADARSSTGITGDFALRIRPNKDTEIGMVGLSATETRSGAPQRDNVTYGFYFNGNSVRQWIAPGEITVGTYSAGETFWLVRIGTTLTYRRGATYDAAMANPPLATTTIPNTKMWLDSNLMTGGASFDVAFAAMSTTTDSRQIDAANNTVVSLQSDGAYRITKNRGADVTWNADARSATGIDGDFILQVRPNKANKILMAGVSSSPTNNLSDYQQLDHALYFTENGTVHAHYGNNDPQISTYVADDTFWMVRTGDTISYYKGSTFENAMLSPALMTIQSTMGTLYFDCSIYQVGASVEVKLSPAQTTVLPVGVTPGIGTSVTLTTTPGVYTITKSQESGWDADARSVVGTAGDFVLSASPNQSAILAMAGIAFSPNSSSSYTDLNFALYFSTYSENGYNNNVYLQEYGGQYYTRAGYYQAGDVFWMERVGTTLSYYKGATLAQAKAVGTIAPSRTGIGGTYYFDSSIASGGSIFNVSFNATATAPATKLTPTKTVIAPFSSTVVTGETVTGSGGGVTTTYKYDSAGRLLNRKVGSLVAESFTFDGLGRLTTSTDLDGAQKTFVYNDAAMTTKVTLGAATSISTFDRAGNLITTVNSGTNIVAGTTTNEYDKLGRLRATTDASDPDLAKAAKTYFLYDSAGRKSAEIVRVVEASGPPTGRVTEYRYDANDRLIATIRRIATVSNIAVLEGTNPVTDVTLLGLASSPEDFSESRRYDAEGRVVAAVGRDGATTVYDYDASGRLIRTTDYANLGIRTGDATFSSPSLNDDDRVARNFYDKDGLLAGALNGEGYLTYYEYDKAGRKLRETAFVKQIDAVLSVNTTRLTGSLNELLANAGFANNAPTNASDRVTRWVYDRQGLLRYRIDPTGKAGEGLGHVTEYFYADGTTSSANGVVRKTVEYAAPLPALSGSYSVTSVKAALASLASAATDRTTYAVYDTSNRAIYRIDAEGAVTSYVYDGHGNVVGETRFATLRPTSQLPSRADMDTWAGTAANTAGNRVSRNLYNDFDQLVFAIDAEGYATRNYYDGEGRVVGTRRWDANIGGAATIAGVQDAVGAAAYIAGKTVYDAFGRVGSRTEGLQGIGNNDPVASGVVTRFEYRANGTLESEAVAYGTPDVATTRYSYDVGTREYRTTRGTGADEVFTTVQYNAFGEIWRETNENGGQTTRLYDHAGRLTSTKDPLLNETKFSYTAFGELKQSIDARQATTNYFYDKAGRATVVQDAANYLTETKYTAFGEIDTVTRRYKKASNSVNNVPTADPDAKDAVTKFSYDRLGRLVGTTDATNKSESYELNAFGQRKKLTNKIGGVTEYGYDRRGLMTSETLPTRSYNNTGTIQAETVTNRYEYDLRGQLKSKTEAFGLTEARTTGYTYDSLGRLKRTDLPQVNNAQNNGLISIYEEVEYDKRGNVLRSRDAGGAWTTYYYDSLDRLVGKVDALLGYVKTSYAYVDGKLVQTDRAYANRLTSATDLSVQPDVLDRETVSTFDKLGRLKSAVVKSIKVGGLDANNAYAIASRDLETKYEYDANGNVLSVTDANGGITYSYYDTMNRKVGQVDQEKYYTKWTRDDSEGNVTTETRYADRQTNAGFGTPPSSITTNAAKDRTTTFEYDANGRRTSETRLNVEYATVSASGTLTPNQSGSSRIDYQYNGLGQVTRKIEATTEAIDYEYDGAGRLKRETRTAYSYANATVTPATDYFYDGLGDLVRTRQGGTVADAATDRVTRYEYGSGGRLYAMIDAAGYNHGYYYDAVGRKIGESYTRETSSGGTAPEGTSYGYDLLGRLTRQSFSTVSGGNFTATGDVTTLGYDVFGGVTSRALNDVVQEQNAYDNAGRLWRSNGGDGVWRYYLSDANGNRTLTIESAGMDLLNKTITQAMQAATGTTATDGSGMIGNNYVHGVNRTIAKYDARGMNTQTTQIARQLVDGPSTFNLTSSRDYTAFGETKTETDAGGAITTYSYNTMGRLLSVQRAAVSVTSATGAVSNPTPTDRYYYDLSGRMITTEDANGNKTRRALVAGTGYAGTEALVAKEWRPEGGETQNGFDVFGDQRVTRELVSVASNNVQTWRETQMSYDKLGRVNTIVRPSIGAYQLTENYAYDVLGQRIRHWDSTRATGDEERTDYDVQGRVIKTRAFGGDETTTAYTWEATGLTAGLSTTAFGLQKATTTFANGKSSWSKSDSFGHVVASHDMGDGTVMAGGVTRPGFTFTYTYDFGGRLLSRAADQGGGSQEWSYYNTGLAATAATGVQASYEADGSPRGYDYNYARYGYDAMGRKTLEQGERRQGAWIEPTRSPSQAGTPWEPTPIEDPETAGRHFDTGVTVFQRATAGYDALGRMTWWNDDGSAAVAAGNGVLASPAMPAAHMSWEYDAVGNVRVERADYWTLDGYGNAAVRIISPVADRWYTYDGMNRMTIARGQWTGSSIVKGQIGVELSYDKAGQRTSETRLEDGMDRRQTFTYRADGALIKVQVKDYAVGTAPAADTVLPDNAGRVAATFGVDLLGRTVEQADFVEGETYAVYNRVMGYNAKGQIEYDNVHQLVDGARVTTNTNNYYVNDAGDYALGAVMKQTITGATTATVYNRYDWYDGAQLKDTSRIEGSLSAYNYYYRDARGVLTSASVGAPGTILSPGASYFLDITNDATGQLVRRGERKNAGGENPNQIWYRFDGQEIGTVGNDTGLEMSYTQSTGDRTGTQGSGQFHNGATGAPAGGYASFGRDYASITSYAQGAGGGSYTVRSGDTLTRIASALWGDANLWYKLASANGLSSPDATLVEGQMLTIPSGVVRSSNNASTFKPYDPSEAYGDLSPLASATTPVPTAAKKNKCGAFGQVLLLAVTVAVSVALPGGGGILGAALNGAISSAAGQLVGLATGIQDKFSFKGVALAAVTAGVAKGLSGGNGLFGAVDKVSGKVNAGVLGTIRDATLRTGLTSAIGSAVSQGIGVATGLQSKFSWAGVAGAGLGAGLAGKATDRFGNGFGGRLLANTASGLANAASRTVIDGTSFGDNLMAALPDVIGQTVGGYIGSKIAGGGRRTVADATQTLIDPLTGRAVVVDAPLLEQINLRRDGKRIDAEIAAGKRNPDGSLRGGAAGGANGPGTGSDTSGRPPGDYLNPDRKETFSRSVNEYWRQGFEREDAAHFNSVGHEYTDAPELRQAYAYRDAYLLKLDAYATQMVDRPIVLASGAVIATAATAGAGTAAAGYFGLSGWSAFGAGVGADGLAAANGGLFYRPLVGERNSLGSYGGDALVGAGTGSVLRLGAVGLSSLVGRIGVGGAAGATNNLANQNPLYKAALGRFGTSDLTNAGRALTKHPEVVGATKDTLRQILRSDASINAAAHSSLKNIMRNGVTTMPTLPRYGQITQTQIPGGFGARWYGDGRFIGFINP